MNESALPLEQYAQILSGSINNMMVFLVFLLIFLVGIIALWKWYRTMDKDSSDGDNSIKWLTVVLAVAIFGGMVWGTVNLTKRIQDKHHASYVVFQGDFLIKEEPTSWRTKPTLSMKYVQNGIITDVQLNTDYCELKIGTYRNATLVYTERSHIVVDVMEEAP